VRVARKLFETTMLQYMCRSPKIKVLSSWSVAENAVEPLRTTSVIL
jgi:hypothetical protein